MRLAHAVSARRAGDERWDSSAADVPGRGVARCRHASAPWDAVFPGVRVIRIRFALEVEKLRSCEYEKKSGQRRTSNVSVKHRGGPMG